MKKALFSFIVLLLPISIFANVSFTGDVPVDMKSYIESAIYDNSRGRDDIEFTISNIKHEEKEEIMWISFNLAFLDRSIAIDIESNPKDLEKNVKEEIRNALFYERTLYLEGEENLDYIYDKSFSFFPEVHYRKGTTFTLKDANGKTQGVFEVKHNYSEASVLQPLYVANALPGMTLKKSSSWRYSITAGTNLYKSNLAISADIGNTSLIYPIVPIVSLLYEKRNQSQALAVGIGVESYLDLNDFLKIGFTLIEEGRIGASASVLLTIEDGSFGYNGTFSIFYEHRLLPKFFWRVGYSRYPKIGNAMIIGIGGGF